jgi:hypothetical protein
MNRNVRTTSQIAVTSSALAYVDRITGGIDGPDVEFVYYEGDGIEDEIRICIEALLVEDVCSDEIVVIVPDGHWLAEASSFLGVRCAAASVMKGLESVAVIFAGLSEIELSESRKCAYISCTRATTLLKVLLPSPIKSSVISAYSALALRNPSN